MGRNIIICSDGTGNTFDRRVTNVTYLISALALDDPRQQVVVYDQGVGTNARRSEVVDAYRRGVGDPSSLTVLSAPLGSTLGPKAWFDRGRGLMTGYGLKENVGQIYQALADLYEGPDDRVFLFGLSRGAFTVRALAGLLYRCHLPSPGSTDFETRFEHAWRLYEPMREDDAATNRLRAEQRPCPIHFLGLWDTVKSYGGIDPVILPHLRHNPIVAHVRHALALNERRAWFKPTSWGLLDSDDAGAMTRLKPEDRLLFDAQDIAEVWFVGCHSDIGGGAREETTARIALRWMLGEALHVDPGVRLNHDGKALLAADDPPGPPQIHESWNRGWRLVEAVPRKEIDNSGTYPVKKAARGSDGKRAPENLQRGKKVVLHATVGNAVSISGDVEIRHTKSLPGEGHY